MKSLIVSFAALLMTCVGCAKAQPISNPEALATYIKVWGFLKYYHPDVVGGKVDWDSEFVANVVNVDREPAANSVDKLIAEAGGDTTFGSNSVRMGDSLMQRASFEWIDDPGISAKARAILHHVRSNQVPSESHYVSMSRGAGNPDFSAESNGDSLPYPALPQRLLAIARYWNVIEYFDPNLDLVGNWSDTLTKYLPLVANAQNAEQYQLAMLQLCCSIRDSHSFTNSSELQAILGKYVLPLPIMAIGKEYYFRKPRIKITLPMTPGDRLVSIAGETIPKLIDKFAPLVPRSNVSAMLRDIGTTMLRRQTNAAVDVAYERDGKILHASIEPMGPTANYPKVDTGATAWRALSPSVGYVNLDLLKVEMLPDMMKEMSAKKAIIFDIRNYPKGVAWDLAPMLGTGLPWARFSGPNYSQPGNFLYNEYAAPSHTKGYGGKIIILVNAQTQSHAEYTAMMFRTVPGCVVIGSQTAGADGNVSRLPLPGGIETVFTGLGVYYLDGKPTQQVGIVPDIEVLPTPAGLRAGRDEVLERAIVEAERN